MSRPKGTKNKVSAQPPPATLLSLEERITFLANLIIDKIHEDQRSDQKLLRKLKQG